MCFRQEKGRNIYRERIKMSFYQVKKKYIQLRQEFEEKWNEKN